MNREDRIAIWAFAAGVFWATAMILIGLGLLASHAN